MINPREPNTTEESAREPNTGITSEPNAEFSREPNTIDGSDGEATSDVVREPNTL